MDTQLKQAITERLEIGRTREAVIEEIQAAGYSEAAATEAVDTVAAELAAVRGEGGEDTDSDTSADTVNTEDVTDPAPAGPPPYLRQTANANAKKSHRLILIAAFALAAVALAAALYLLEINIHAPLEALPLPF